MDLNPEKPRFSSFDAKSDSEDREISEHDEDDDRNHKHRRRDAHSHSLEGDSRDQALTTPYRKRNRPFENGYSYIKSDPQSNESWRNDNGSSGRDFPSRFDSRRSNLASFSKAPMELHQSIRGNQTFLSEAGPVRWGIRDSRLGLLDVPSRVVRPGHVPSWNALTLFPGIPNSGLHPLHPLGLQGALRPAIDPNIGILRQRCRDFEELGFCLRGDMCPMEHGVNRIVVDDVQSLSQFNLPVALPGPQLLGTSSAQGTLPVNNQHFHAKISKPGMTENVFGINGGVLGVSLAGASDVYDPDQPLWTNDDHQTHSRIRALNQSTEPFLDVEFSNRKKIKPIEGLSEEPLRDATTSSSVRGRIGGSKFNSEAKKAFRTLFVSGIPLKDNRRETLLSHFQKFGEVIDIYTPMHSQRAFVQFSKREQAEAALKAPDAVMGNRFIKLFWANRDTIPNDRISGFGSDSRGVTTNPPPSVNAHASVGQLSFREHSRPVVGDGPKVPPPQQKKLESLELLKEQIRKKQEMLDQKRNEFRRQLDKLEIQAVGSKDVTVADLNTKRIKDETPPNHAKVETSKSSSSRDNIKTENATSIEHAISHKSTSNPTVRVQEHLRPSFFSPPLTATPLASNRFNLDNRPTTFSIVSPLPDDLANVAALEEHFSAYGEVCSVELKESHQDDKDASIPSNVAACVSFTTRSFAEKAFLHGKIWQGHKLQFMWLKSGNTCNENGDSGKNLSNVHLGSDENEIEANLDSREHEE